ncbi:hypothetical protein F5Y15DRAFT_104445 [Xylariaceae sp. FL0016]|nr:hypothetical protein F5Y15DRAFT_104445 [Xylariaceae sp. FL0016]
MPPPLGVADNYQAIASYRPPSPRHPITHALGEDVHPRYYPRQISGDYHYNDYPGNWHLSGGAIAGIVVGCVIGAVLLLWVLYCFWALGRPSRTYYETATRHRERRPRRREMPYYAPEGLCETGRKREYMYGRTVGADGIVRPVVSVGCGGKCCRGYRDKGRVYV